ncbi:MAG TPA: hypothetical protein PLN54_08070 [Flavobacteriales bacterium]|nr:hypothetical protein [Flavobacteriales bacterium]
MRATLFLFASLSFGIAIGQTTFNVVREHPSVLSYNGALSVNEVDDGYLMFSFGWSLDSTVGAVFITKFDLEGNFQWEKEHKRDRTTSPGIIDPIAAISGDRYVGAMTAYGGQAPNVTYLYWWNSEGDTLATRFLKSDSAYLDNHGTRQLIALADGGFLHCGWCANTPPGQGGCIIRLDSTGTILWERIYPQAQYIDNARETPSGGFVLGGSRNAQQDEAVVIRTDSAGNVQWVRYHGLHGVTGGNQALLDDEGNVLMAGLWKDDPSPLTEESWACMYKYAPNGPLLVRRDYYFTRLSVAVHTLHKGTGHYWLVGGAYQVGLDPDFVTLLWELDENVDSLWMRRYWHYASNGAESAAYSVRSTSDGGLVMCGVTRQGQTDPLPYKQDNWLIKLDGYGCLVPGCHTVGIEEVAMGLDQYLSISPNPVVSGQPLRITFEPPAEFTAKGTLRVVVLDATGRLVHEERMGGATLDLFMNKLTSGLYYLHLTDGSRWLAGGKVLYTP